MTDDCDYAEDRNGHCWYKADLALDPDTVDCPYCREELKIPHEWCDGMPDEGEVSYGKCPSCKNEFMWSYALSADFSSLRMPKDCGAE